MSEIRLTELAHGGGCGCKLAPAVLQQLLNKLPTAGLFPRLLVGTETADDAAVWELPDGGCIIATTDFFMPVVDNPRDFGRIAATNAISDVYAMGGTPLFALAILGVPIAKLPVEVTREILAGGSEACANANIPVAGGHSIDTVEPIYGLVVIGHASKDRIRRNSGAQPGDVLLLTKPIGIGIYANALRKGALDELGYAEMLATTTQLNGIGARLAEEPAVHAMTDVTGFGVFGHGLEMARGSHTALRIDAASIPLLSQARRLARDGYVTGASHRNWESYSDGILSAAALSEDSRHLLTDAQTSGGLLVSCGRDEYETILAMIRKAGFANASVIGTVEAGPAGLIVEGS